MNQNYPNLLSPLKIGNHVLKNRMTATTSRGHHLQGPENFPTDAYITHYANKARGGAAMVTVLGGRISDPVPGFGTNSENKGAHSTSFNITNSLVQNYVAQLAESVHFYGSKVLMWATPYVPLGWDVSDDIDPLVIVPGSKPAAGPTMPGKGKALTKEMLDEIKENLVKQCIIYKECGVDGTYLHMSYRMQLLGRFLSKATNKRSDEYGGSIENMARYPLEVCRAIKQACGKNFIIHISISAEDCVENGWSIEDTITFCKMAEGLVDIVQPRCPEIDPNHPVGYAASATPFMHYPAALKAAGVPQIVEATAGYFDPDENEKMLAEGKADLIGMARAWISNPMYGVLVEQGRTEDIVPCIRCNKCHSLGPGTPPICACSVNPEWALETKIARMVDVPFEKKNIAVVGGGPGGMEAALIASRRGHDVTLYEKTDRLGGLLIPGGDTMAFKWPLRKFKEYMIAQIEKSDVKVVMNTEATAETLQGYDAAIIAVGSKPMVLPIPGIDGKNVFFASETLAARENELADEVVIIGGGEIGVETGIHLAQLGKKVTVVEMRSTLAADTTVIHFKSMLIDAWEREENFNYVVNATCKRIEEDGVVYADKDGVEHKIPAGSVVMSAGMVPESDKAIELGKGGKVIRLVGDCAGAGNLQKVMRSAYAAASLI